MKTEPNDSIFDRFAFALLGALTGAAYGIPLSFMVLVITQHFYISLIVWPAVVFAVLGFFFEKIILNAIVALFSILEPQFPNIFSSLSPKNPPSKTLFWTLIVVASLGCGIETLWFFYKN